jgi:hypothetical protein
MNIWRMALAPPLLAGLALSLVGDICLALLGAGFFHGRLVNCRC